MAEWNGYQGFAGSSYQPDASNGYYYNENQGRYFPAAGQSYQPSPYARLDYNMPFGGNVYYANDLEAAQMRRQGQWQADYQSPRLDQAPSQACEPQANYSGPSGSQSHPQGVHRAKRHQDNAEARLGSQGGQLQAPARGGRGQGRGQQQFGRREPRKERWEQSRPPSASAEEAAGSSPGYRRHWDAYHQKGAGYTRSYEAGNRQNYRNKPQYYGENSGRTFRSQYRRDGKGERETENWRSFAASYITDKPRDKPSSASSSKDSKPVEKKAPKTDKLKANASQRERLTEQVNRGMLECLVCCERVRQVDSVWSCSKCFHVLHLKCIIKWANTSKAESGWRCPACQFVCADIPSEYFCYCGKMSNPSYKPGDTAHSCGDVCGRKGIKPSCTHHCQLLCHPGPCLECEVQVTRSCGCESTKQMIKCSSDVVIVCKNQCNKQLNCSVHKCDRKCHGGDCSKCTETIVQECFCGKNGRKVPCTLENVGVENYTCGDVCGKSLSCGNHKCLNECHEGDCQPCPSDVDVILTCPCGKKVLEEPRKSCLDAVPTCGQVCQKRLRCGQMSNPHLCRELCHEKECPVCPLTTSVRCRCGNMDRAIPCAELTSRADDARCEKKCQKKRSCLKHKCNQPCCIDIDHICPMICTRKLSCGLHRCEQPCHRGNCLSCLQSSFEELYCECGANVIYPPVPCGTRRPPCNNPCSREHACDHEVLHTCHSAPECPPCIVLTTKFCHGEHESRGTIPCHQTEFSCGMPCGKELNCRRHKCMATCHKGDCLTDGQVCTQPCNAIRELCGHICGLPCHEPPCAKSSCKETVKVTCECGVQKGTRLCVDMTKEYHRIAASMIAAKMSDLQLHSQIDITEITASSVARRQAALKILDCTEECRQLDRSRRFAIALQLRNPDLSSKLTPRYSDFMRQWAKKDPTLCQRVHDKLTELVQLAKESKQKSRSYSFESMNRDKRSFVHEYCEHFGCESAAYDQEPNRNVVATAFRDKSWLPSVGLLELIQRESGQRKVPGPVVMRPSSGILRPTSSVPLRLPTKPSVSSINNQNSVPSPEVSGEEDEIDYFNFQAIK